MKVLTATAILSILLFAACDSMSTQPPGILDVHASLTPDSSAVTLIVRVSEAMDRGVVTVDSAFEAHMLTEPVNRWRQAVFTIRGPLYAKAAMIRLYSGDTILPGSTRLPTLKGLKVH